MGRDVLRRVRWGNVALAAAVAAALVVAVAWPRIAASPPALPRDTATPLVKEAPHRRRGLAHEVKAVRRREKPKRSPRTSPRRPRKHRAKPRRPVSPTPTPTPPARAPHVGGTAAPPRVLGTAAPPSSGAGEFGFER